MKITRLDYYYLSADDIDTKLTKQSNISLARHDYLSKESEALSFSGCNSACAFFLCELGQYICKCVGFSLEKRVGTRVCNKITLSSQHFKNWNNLVRYYWAEWHSINLFDLIEIHASFIKNRKISFPLVLYKNV